MTKPTNTFELGDYVTFTSSGWLSREGKVINKQLYIGTVWLTVEYLVGEEALLALLKEEHCNHA